MAPNPITPWLKRLQRRFSPRRVRLGSESVQTLAGGLGKGLECIVGRELCLYLHIDARKVPSKQRAAFIELAVRRAAPFDDPEHGLAWTRPGLAAVWYWSRSRVIELLGPQTGNRTTFVPEAVFTGGRQDVDARQLLELQNGIEGRIWKDGRLAASRWWPAMPALVEWQTFLRSAGQDSGNEGQLPAASPAPIGAESWGARPGGPGFQPASIEALLPRTALALAGFAVLVLSFESGRLIRAHVDRAASSRAAGQMDEALRQILAAREGADASRRDIESLLLLRSTRPQGALFAEVTRLMGGMDWSLGHWLMPTGDRLEVSMTVPGADAERLVSTWEASPMFSGVTIDVSSRNDEVSIMARIDPPATLEGP